MVSKTYVGPVSNLSDRYPSLYETLSVFIGAIVGLTHRVSDRAILTWLVLQVLYEWVIRPIRTDQEGTRDHQPMVAQGPILREL